VKNEDYLTGVSLGTTSSILLWQTKARLTNFPCQKKKNEVRQLNSLMASQNSPKDN